MTSLDPKGLQAALERIAAIKYPDIDTHYALKATIDYARDQARIGLEESASTTPSGEVEGLVERAAEAFAAASVVYPGGQTKTPIWDWFDLDAQDAVDFGVLQEPKWHFYSDIRGDQHMAYVAAVVREPIRAALSEASTALASMKREVEKLPGLADGYGKLDAEYAIAERRAEAAEARIQELETERQWQPIETAPKNKKLLVAYQNRLGNWRIVTGCYHTQLAWSDDHWRDDDDESEYAPEGWYEESDSSETIYRTDLPPTHWMPLPTPPQALGRE